MEVKNKGVNCTAMQSTCQEFQIVPSSSAAGKRKFNTVRSASASCAGIHNLKSLGPRDQPRSDRACASGVSRDTEGWLQAWWHERFARKFAEPCAPSQVTDRVVDRRLLTPAKIAVRLYRSQRRKPRKRMCHDMLPPILHASGVHPCLSPFPVGPTNGRLCLRRSARLTFGDSTKQRRDCVPDSPTKISAAWSQSYKSGSTANAYSLRT